MRSFEVLSAALFTLDATGSGLAVAVVSAARTLPMLLLGAFAGVLSEAVDRKRILLVGQIVSGIGSGDDRRARRVRHRAAHGTSALAALVAGTVWSTEMSTRRRMVGECVAGALVPRALALDTVTNSITRLIGPMAAGAAYQVTGACRRLRRIARVFLPGRDDPDRGTRLPADQPQDPARRDVPRDLAEAFAFARGHVIIGGVLAVTIAMNLLGFCYYGAGRADRDGRCSWYRRR